MTQERLRYLVKQCAGKAWHTPIGTKRQKHYTTRARFYYDELKKVTGHKTQHFGAMSHIVRNVVAPRTPYRWFPY